MSESLQTLPVICICGPTSCGKSSVAVSLANEIGGEVVNADSVQAYKMLDIGSGKMTREEEKGVPHHLFSYIGPEETFSSGRFRKDALPVIEDIIKRGKVPIVVGGSGMYFSTLLGGFIDLKETPMADLFLEQIKKQIGTKELPMFFWKLLRAIDPASSELFPISDYPRVERSLRLVLHSGVPRAAFAKSRSESDTRLRALVFVFEPKNRELLYQRINARVVDMFNAGWLNEVISLLKSYARECPAMRSLGYRHIVNYLTQKKLNVSKGLSSDSEVLDSLIIEIQRDTRRYAKRQMTWWRHQPYKLGWSELGCKPFAKGLDTTWSSNFSARETCGKFEEPGFERANTPSPLSSEFSSESIRENEVGLENSANIFEITSMADLAKTFLSDLNSVSDGQTSQNQILTGLSPHAFALISVP